MVANDSPDYYGPDMREKHELPSFYPIRPGSYIDRIQYEDGRWVHFPDSEKDA